MRTRKLLKSEQLIKILTENGFKKTKRKKAYATELQKTDNLDEYIYIKVADKRKPGIVIHPTKHQYLIDSLVAAKGINITKPKSDADWLKATSYTTFPRPGGVTKSGNPFSPGGIYVGFENEEAIIEFLSIIYGIDIEENTLKDIENIQSAKTSETTKKQLIDARLGQGKFRKDLEHKFGNKCPVTGITERSLLRASHIKAWGDISIDDQDERLDKNNGILLSVHLDALFDKYLLTFNASGKMYVFEGLGEPEKSLLPNEEIKISLDRETLEYLKHHRKKCTWFQNS